MNLSFQFKEVDEALVISRQSGVNPKVIVVHCVREIFIVTEGHFVNRFPVIIQSPKYYYLSEITHGY